LKQLSNQPQKTMMVQKAGIKIKNEPGSSRRNSKVMEKAQQQKQVRNLNQISSGKQFANNPVSTVTLNVNSNQQKVLLAQLNGGMVLQQPQYIKQRVSAQQGGRQQAVSSKGKTLQYNTHIIGSTPSQIIQTSGVQPSINQSALIRQRRPQTSNNVNINTQNKMRHPMSSHVVLPPQQMLQRVSSHNSQQSNKNLQQPIQVAPQQKTYQLQSGQMNINMLQNQQFASPNQIIKLQPNPIPTSIENDNKED